MIRREIINEELIEHINRASRVLQPQQRQHGRGPTSHLMDHQWNQVGTDVSPISGQVIAIATLNVMPTLAYEDVVPKTNTQQIGQAQQAPQRERGRERGPGPRGKSNHPEYCNYHYFYNHNTTYCRDITWHPRWKDPKNDQRNDSSQ